MRAGLGPAAHTSKALAEKEGCARSAERHARSLVCLERSIEETLEVLTRHDPSAVRNQSPGCRSTLLACLEKDGRGFG